MQTDPNPIQKPGFLTWLGTAAVAVTAVGYGVINHKEIGATIARLRSVEQVPSVSQPAVPVEAVVAPKAPVAPVAVVVTAGARMVFDIVRVETDGTTLVAGRADPGKTVSVVVDGTAQGEVVVDATGSFVAFLDLSESDEPRVMWLMAETDDGAMVVSDSSVILAPRAGPSAVPRVVVGLDGAPVMDGADRAVALSVDRDVVGQPIEAPASAAVQTSAVTVAPPPSVETPSPALDPGVATSREVQTPEPDSPAEPMETARDLPPRVLVSDLEGVRVFDAPQLADPGDLRLDTISYGAEGVVVLRGRTGPGGAIQFSLSGKDAGQTVAGADGLWLAQLGDVPAGDYTLRVERKDASGDVLNVVSLPFRRESPERLAQALGPHSIQVMTVQPGATLWAIARERYGDGAQYVQVFEANKAQINDPNLIYPGQVFGLPQDQGSAE